jgi:uncharacterized Zn finger protein
MTECEKCGGPMTEEVAWLVSGQVNGPRESMVLLVCQQCGHTVKGEDTNEATTDISEGDRS